MADASTKSRSAPTHSQRMFFGTLLPLFFVLLGLMLIRRPHGLVVAAGFCGVATLATMLLDRSKIASHILSLLIPAVLLAMFGLTRAGVPARTVALTGIAFGMVLGICALASAPAGNGIYDFWMRLGEPIGYSVSLLLLAISFYVVFTPLGLIMRAMGTDPMHRKSDKSAATYWTEHDPSGDATRYFRQF